MRLLSFFESFRGSQAAGRGPGAARGPLFARFTAEVERSAATEFETTHEFWMQIQEWCTGPIPHLWLLRCTTRNTRRNPGTIKGSA